LKSSSRAQEQVKTWNGSKAQEQSGENKAQQEPGAFKSQCENFSATTTNGNNDINSRWLAAAI
jgi:hypothetical protein